MSRFQLHTTNNSLCTGTIDDPTAHLTTFELLSKAMSSAQPESEQHPFNFDAPPSQPPDTETILPAAPADPQLSDGEFLMQAIDKIVKSNLPNKVKLREPNPFDGSDTQKLCTFILQCKLNF